MDTPPKTLTYFTTGLGPHGRERRVEISLPFVEAIAGEAHYQPPSPAAQDYFAGERRGPAMTAARIRKALGKDPETTARLADRLKYESVTRRILREGW